MLGEPAGFHADWPWSQTGPAAAPGALPVSATGTTMRAAPRMPDMLADMQTFWLLTDFTKENHGPPRDSDPPGTVPAGSPEIFSTVNPYGKYILGPGL